MRSILVIQMIILFTLGACSKERVPFLPQFLEIDYLIKNGTIVDGTGRASYLADIVVVGDQIVFIGEEDFSYDDSKVRIKNNIDAKGKIVSPGFIDLHSHGDPLKYPYMQNFLAMGVTTMTLGMDGSSPEINPLSLWMEEIDKQGIGPNLAMLIGHGSLRNLSGIGVKKNPTKEELEKMLSMLDESLKYTFGLSTGLEYSPGLNAESHELRSLAKVIGKNNRLIMSHMRNEDDDHLEDSIAELLEQGEHARVHISHLKSVYGKGVDRAEEILNILNSARDSGIDVTAEIYPYNASYTGIGIVFPIWSKTQEEFNKVKLSKRKELESYLVNRINQRNGPESTLLGTAPYTGKTLADLSHEKEMNFEDILIDEIGPNGASGAYFVMNEDLQNRLLLDPNIGICSDGSISGYHPRGHGTFAKIIEKYVVNEGMLSLEEAIRKMTSFAAKVIGIDDRGILREGMKADIIIFNPNKVRARASYTNPFLLAEGFDIVMVNGKKAWDNQKHSDQLWGQVLKPN